MALAQYYMATHGFGAKVNPEEALNVHYWPLSASVQVTLGEIPAIPGGSGKATVIKTSAVYFSVPTPWMARNKQLRIKQLMVRYACTEVRVKDIAVFEGEKLLHYSKKSLYSTDWDLYVMDIPNEPLITFAGVGVALGITRLPAKQLTAMTGSISISSVGCCFYAP